MPKKRVEVNIRSMTNARTVMQTSPLPGPSTKKVQTADGRGHKAVAAMSRSPNPSPSSSLSSICIYATLRGAHVRPRQQVLSFTKQAPAKLPWKELRITDQEYDRFFREAEDRNFTSPTCFQTMGIPARWEEGGPGRHPAAGRGSPATPSSTAPSVTSSCPSRMRSSISSKPASPRAIHPRRYPQA